MAEKKDEAAQGEVTEDGETYTAEETLIGICSAAIDEGENFGPDELYSVLEEYGWSHLWDMSQQVLEEIEDEEAEGEEPPDDQEPDEEPN